VIVMFDREAGGNRLSQLSSVPVQGEHQVSVTVTSDVAAARRSRTRPFVFTSRRGKQLQSVRS
jgi:hypothetical protein